MTALIILITKELILYFIVTKVKGCLFITKDLQNNFLLQGLSGFCCFTQIFVSIPTYKNYFTASSKATFCIILTSFLIFFSYCLHIVTKNQASIYFIIIVVHCCIFLSGWLKKTGMQWHFHGLAVRFNPFHMFRT